MEYSKNTLKYQDKIREICIVCLTPVYPSEGKILKSPLGTINYGLVHPECYKEMQFIKQIQLRLGCRYRRSQNLVC